MGVELSLHVVVTILECCVTFSGVKLSIRSFVLFLRMDCIDTYHNLVKNKMISDAEQQIEYGQRELID